jgi:hypothetical protein
MLIKEDTSEVASFFALSVKKKLPDINYLSVDVLKYQRDNQFYIN